MMGSKKREESPPKTPHTGFEENSSVGLFFSQNPKSKKWCPMAIVTVNTNALEKEIDDSADAIFQSKEKGHLKLDWEFKVALSEKEDGVVETAAFILRLQEETPDGDRVDLLSIGSIFPLAVVKAFLDTATKEDPSDFVVSFLNLDGDKLQDISGPSDSTEVSLMLGKSELSKSAFLVFKWTATFEDEVERVAKIFAENKLKDAIYKNGDYPARPMYIGGLG
jgi:hypothetical protein